MDLCVLPQTGVGEQWLLLVVVAAIVVAAGVALVVGGRARRSVLTGLGAIAIVGALVVGGVGGAPAAQADAGSDGCVTAPHRPAPASAAIVVTPGIPATTAQCAAEPTLQVPTTTGVVYSQTRAGSSVTVTATAAPGYALLAGAAASWTFDVTPTTRAPWPVDLPERVQTTRLLGTGDYGVTFLDPADPDFEPSLQAAAVAGELSYSLDASEFTQTVPVGVYDLETEEELALTTLIARTPANLGYNPDLDVYVVGSSLSDEQAIAQWSAQIAALEEQYPGAIVLPAGPIPFPLSIEYTGLRINAAYIPGPGCDYEIVRVPIDVENPEPPILGDAPAASLFDEPAPSDPAETTDATPTEAGAEPTPTPSAETHAPSDETPAPSDETPAPSDETPATEVPLVDDPTVVVEP